MIVKVRRSDIETAWPILQLAAEEALPPYAEAHDASRNNIHEMLLSGQLEAWLIYGVDDDQPTLYASIITSINTDNISGTRVLEMYAMYGYQRIPMEQWQEMADMFYKYARAKKCQRVIAFTNSNSISQVLTELGGIVEYKFFVWEVVDNDRAAIPG